MSTTTPAGAETSAHSGQSPPSGGTAEASPVGAPVSIAARRRADQEGLSPADVVVLAVLAPLRVLMGIRMATGGDLGI